MGRLIACKDYLHLAAAIYYSTKSLDRLFFAPNIELRCKHGTLLIIKNSEFVCLYFTAFKSIFFPLYLPQLLATKSCKQYHKAVKNLDKFVFIKLYKFCEAEIFL